MKEKIVFCRQLLLKSSYIILISIYPNLLMAQFTQLCNDNRQFYTKLTRREDTSVFIKQELFNSSIGLYGMSAADSIGNEIDCNVAAFRFILMRKNEILYSTKFDKYTLNTLDTLSMNIKQFGITQGDIFIFTDIKIKHFYISTYCYHDGVPMLKVIDNFKTYSSIMIKDPYKDFDRYEPQNKRNKSLRKKN